MVESKATGTDSKQDRSNQPKRAGGNSASFGIEKHRSDKAERIAICGEGGSGGHGEVGKVVATTSPRKEGGNSVAAPSCEKHDQSKAMGKKSVGGKVVGEAPVVDANIQASERRHGAGNDDGGGHEKSGQAKARRLDMSTKRFER